MVRLSCEYVEEADADLSPVSGFRVVVDTGSTDLWLDLEGIDIQVSNTTDLIVDSPYAVGDVKGNVLFSELRIGPYIIPHQGNTITYFPRSSALI